ncbi:MAG: acetyl-CoA carboxylase biotin carboxylase subunit [Proteobacteria bacterium]|nr:acetyl-CoA carboxylase biotin carboxylase subunit [Pseudomonadota bacterium]
MNKIKTLLIANRGEIACRIIKTAKQLNIKTIAIYADSDKNALHCKLADCAYRVGPDSLEKSYLNIDNILNIAKECQADAIHPGYGFLSENADFAFKCEQQGFVFVGPSSDAIAKMAVKDEAKDLMMRANVPTVPGYMGKAQDLKTLTQAAKDIGYPVMLKAAKGGGGKGMRVVHQASELKDAIETAKRESLKSFGDDTLFIEKYLTKARHIEVQIFRDTFGNTLHLYERDCSLQRRHQKIIEESPAMDIPDEVKQQLYQAAINAANAIDYRGAGTIEFLYTSAKQFYFMEMNTRLQVEHPVTEMVTGLDLVHWQLLVADGQPLPLKQNQIKSTGHAIETRIYAEDPYHQFLPSTGTIKAIFLPQGVNYRLDSGIQKGDAISIYFDPMLAKLIVHGENRKQTILGLQLALNQFHLVGLTTNLPFLRNVLNDNAFQTGKIHTQHIEEKLETLLPHPRSPSTDILSLACYIALTHSDESLLEQETYSPWKQLKAWRLNLPNEEDIQLDYLNEAVSFKVTHSKMANAFLHITHLTSNEEVNLSARMQDEIIDANFNTHEMHANFYVDNRLIEIFYEGVAYQFKRKAFSIDELLDKLNPEHSLLAPMPGIISKIWVKAGQSVNKGAKLVALEAMKMEHTVFSPQDGQIKSIRYQIGDQVEEGCELIDFE